MSVSCESLAALQAVLLAFVWLPVTSQDASVQALSDVIGASHAACRRELNPGMAVAIVKDSRILLSRGFGVTSLHGNIPVTSSTRFNVASLTKALTAALLVKVMDDSGRYNISTPVREIMGRYFRFADDLRTQHATVEDILSHKMAIPANNKIRFDSTLTRRTLPGRLKFLDSFDTFRSTYMYSNLMYGLASRMAEVVAGERWEDLAERHFFRPLDMQRSTFLTQLDLSDMNTARPYQNYFGALKPLSGELLRLYGELVGSGGLVSTADDMAQWMNFFLTGGFNGKGQRIMSEDILRELQKPRTAMPMVLFSQPEFPVTSSFDIYAMGWWSGYYRGYPVLGHSGASYGYRAFVVLVPSLKAGVFVVMTGDDSGYPYRGPLVSLMLDHVMGVTSWVNASILCSFPMPWQPVRAPSSIPPYDPSRPLAHNVTAYLGTYVSLAYGRLEIRLKAKDRTGGTHTRRIRSLRRGHQLELIYGFGAWDLIPVPPHAASPSRQTADAEPSDVLEFFYGKGTGVTQFVDLTPLIVHPPPTGSAVIVRITIPGFETRVPPVFWRNHAGSGGNVSRDREEKTLWACIVLWIFVFRRLHEWR